MQFDEFPVFLQALNGPNQDDDIEGYYPAMKISRRGVARWYTRLEPYPLAIALKALEHHYDATPNLEPSPNALVERIKALLSTMTTPAPAWARDLEDAMQTGGAPGVLQALGARQDLTPWEQEWLRLSQLLGTENFAGQVAQACLRNATVYPAEAERWEMYADAFAAQAAGTPHPLPPPAPPGWSQVMQPRPPGRPTRRRTPPQPQEEPYGDC